MMTCIACSKQLADAGDEEPAAAAARGGSTPRTKEVVRSLTSQIKDMVLKFSGAYRQSKPCNGGTSSSSAAAAAYRRSRSVGAIQKRRSYDGTDAVRESVEGRDRQYRYARAGGRSSSSSIAGWDFTCAGAEAPAVAMFADSQRRRIQGLRPQGAERSREEGGQHDMAVEENGEQKEWVAQVEPGVHITFFSVAGGGNDLKRIRFSREMFNKWQAQRWWGENYDRIVELYNVQRFSRQALPTPPRSDDEVKVSGSAEQSPAAPPMGVGRTPASRVGGGHEWGGMFHPVPDPTEHVLQYYQNSPVAAPPGTWWRPGEAASSADASMTATTPSRDEASASVSNASDQEAAEWVEQDEPGVYITVRQLPDGTRELRRVRFSREHFAERHAKQWWELNRERIQAQYL